uniref:Uncharacterized protein n=1 Tax=Ditylenchus dipsaci TaxID=166011 RepID=A0A915DK82_9BILA
MMDPILYECSCGARSSLIELYHCFKCDCLKCPVCAVEEIQLLFCLRCCNDISPGENLTTVVMTAVCARFAKIPWLPNHVELAGTISSAIIASGQVGMLGWLTKFLP